MIDIQKRHATIGAEIRGVSLDGDMDDATFAAIRQAWLDHLVLVFPDQPISDEAHIAFGKRFGALEVHPSLAHRASTNPEIYRVSNVDEQGALIPPTDTGWQYLSQSWRWHTDSSFRAVPSNGSILHGIETTNDGGDTLFADMYAAYDALPEETKTEIAGLRVVHDHDFILSLSKELQAKQDKGRYDDLPPVTHPLVRVHPETGRKSLFLSPHTMAAVEGMDAGAGRALLDRLSAHATEDRFVYRHRWRNDDVIMWDNRCTMHSVEPFDNARIRRVMHRVTLVGDQAPIAA